MMALYEYNKRHTHAIKMFSNQMSWIRKSIRRLMKCKGNTSCKRANHFCQKNFENMNTLWRGSSEQHLTLLMLFKHPFAEASQGMIFLVGNFLPLQKSPLAHRSTIQNYAFVAKHFDIEGIALERHKSSALHLKTLEVFQGYYARFIGWSCMHTNAENGLSLWKKLAKLICHEQI